MRWGQVGSGGVRWGLHGAVAKEFVGHGTLWLDGRWAHGHAAVRADDISDHRGGEDLDVHLPGINGVLSIGIGDRLVSLNHVIDETGNGATPNLH